MPLVIALPELLAICGLIFCLGMIYGGKAFTDALFQVANSTLGWVPWLGGKTKAPLQAIQKRINNRFSAMAAGIEGAISQSWHVLATLVEQTGAAIWDATQVAARAYWLVTVKYPLDVISAVAHKARGAVSTTTKITQTTVKRVTVVRGVTAAQLVRFGRRVARLEARMAAIPLIGAGALALPFPRLGSLERRARTQAKRLTRVERKLGGLTFAALVATALARLGAGWIRCTNVRKLGRGVCRTDAGFLDALIANGLLIVGTLSLAQMARELREPTDLITSGIGSLVREIPRDG